MVDVHLHTKFSFDSEEEPENYIKEMAKHGVIKIGFSEHYDYDAFLDGEKDITLADLEGYTENVINLRNNHKEIEILQGIEFGYRKEAVSHYNKLIDKYPFDYVINSLHTLKGRGDCYHDKFFEGRELKESYTDYFNGVLESIKADYDYQIVGHIGYVCRYRSGEGAQIKYNDFADILDEILKSIIARDKCLEINTSNGVGGCT
ncbi:MAG: histidinol-phosphatase HisJ family protein, partial [Candidatus Coproplasma sp.]